MARNVVVGDQTVEWVAPAPVTVTFTFTDWRSLSGAQLDNREITARAERAYTELTNETKGR